MIDILIKHILPTIEGLPFADLVAGVVRIAARRVGEEGELQTFPIACNANADECDQNGTYMQLVPDDAKRSIIYFEDNGYFKSGQGLTGLPEYTAQVRLIGWLNLKELGQPACSSASQAVGAIIKALPASIPSTNDNAFFNVSISFNGEEKRGDNLFSQYTYDMPRTQYLMYPFDCFGINLELKFTLNKKCLPDVEVGNKDICNNG